MSAVSMQPQVSPYLQPEASENPASPLPGSYTLLGRVVENFRQYIHAAAVAILVTAVVMSILQGNFFIAAVLGITATYHFTLLQALQNSLSLKKTNIQLRETSDKLQEENTKLSLIAGDFNGEVKNLKSTVDNLKYTTQKLNEDLEKFTKETAVLEVVSKDMIKGLDSFLKDFSGNLDLSNDVLLKLVNCRDTFQEAMDKTQTLNQEYLTENLEELRQLVQAVEANKGYTADTLKAFKKMLEDLEKNQKKTEEMTITLREADEGLKKTEESLKRTQENLQKKQEEDREREKLLATREKQLQEEREHLQKLHKQFVAQCEVLVGSGKLLCDQIMNEASSPTFNDLTKTIHKLQMQPS